MLQTVVLRRHWLGQSSPQHSQRGMPPSLRAQGQAGNYQRINLHVGIRPAEKWRSSMGWLFLLKLKVGESFVPGQSKDSAIKNTDNPELNQF